ncbi:MAG TPA: hypothetical protein V6C88_00255 [Chroococcidiopsis sp.]
MSSSPRDRPLNLFVATMILVVGGVLIPVVCVLAALAMPSVFALALNSPFVGQLVALFLLLLAVYLPIRVPQWVRARMKRP